MHDGANYFGDISDGCDLADIIFIVDSSGSIKDLNPTNWDQMLRFLKDVVTTFGITRGDNRFALVVFSDDAVVEFYLDSFTNTIDIENAINGITYYGGRTNIADGFQTTLDQVFNQRGDRSNVPNIVILITDGTPNERVGDSQPQANIVKESGARVMIVGVTSDADSNLLRSLATTPSDYISIPSFADLSNIVRTLVDASCPSLTPPPPTGNYHNQCNRYCYVDSILYLLSFELLDFFLETKI